MQARLLLSTLLLLFPTFAHAMSLRVAPVLLDVVSPGKATQLTLSNAHDQPITVQLRIYRWTQVNGEEKLEPTQDVVVSPPMTTLNKSAEYVVRIIHINPRLISGEESYRLIIDEVPDLTRRANGTVAFALRQSIPVFFSSPEAEPAHVTWSLQRAGKNYVVTARNDGARRLRVSNLTLKDEKGRSVASQNGLVGYVLGGSQASWRIASPGGSLRTGAFLQIAAESEARPIRAKARLGANP